MPTRESNWLWDRSSHVSVLQHTATRGECFIPLVTISQGFSPLWKVWIYVAHHTHNQVLPCFQWSSWRDLALSVWHRDWEGRITCNRNYNYDTIQLPNMDDLQPEIFHTSYPLPGGVQTAYLLNILSFSQPTDRNERQPSHTCNNPTRGGPPT